MVFDAAGGILVRNVVVDLVPLDDSEFIERASDAVPKWPESRSKSCGEHTCVDEESPIKA